MQRDPEDLYELGADVPDLDGVAMLHHLEGFMDAGAAGRLLAEHLMTACESETIATFDVDRLIDYRSRRPMMTYSTDHWEDYERPELAVRLMHDSAGVPFLLLTGPEPDHEWELFAAAVQSLSARLGGGPLIGFHGIPMGVPHTRPLGVISHGTRPELIDGRQQMPNKLQVPGSAAALVELRLGQAGRDALGFAVNVPHYLAQAVYPEAAATLLDKVTAATGLDLPSDALRVAADRTNSEIDRQVSESAEVAELVTALERQYDALAESGEAGDTRTACSTASRCPPPMRSRPSSSSSSPTSRAAATLPRTAEPVPHPPGGFPGERGSPSARTAASRRPGPQLAVGQDEVAGYVVQPFGAVLGAHHDVLDAGSVRPRVDARLDRERHARAERLGVARHDVGILV